MRQRVDKYLIPVIGKMRIDAVEPMHISNMLDRIVDAGAPTTATDVLSYTKRIFNHAIKRHIIKHNPAAAYDSSDAGGKEESRTRYLTGAELTQLFKAMANCDTFTQHHYLCTKLLLLLGCRKSELFKAKRSDFALDAGFWRVSIENKTESALTIPLSKPALSVIKELMNLQNNGNEYLIPARGSKPSRRGHIEESYLNKPIKEQAFP
jgi:Site-specific recombinase XerD